MSVIIPLPETILKLYADNMITKKPGSGQGLFISGNNARSHFLYLLINFSFSPPKKSCKTGLKKIR
jgi:hypothetical protein